MDGWIATQRNTHLVFHSQHEQKVQKQNFFFGGISLLVIFVTSFASNKK